MISLGQVALLTIGCWVGTRLAYATSLPFPLLLLATGGDHLRDRRARRAARAASVRALPRADHADVRGRDDDRPRGDRLPERRRRLQGSHRRARRLRERAPVRRPSWAPCRHRVLPLRRRRRARSCSCSRCCTSSAKPGRAWASIRESEPAALAAGVNITLYKLWAFALASFMTGVAGCLLAAQVGVPRAITFQTQDSLTLAATALIGGIFSLWGAVVAGVLRPVPAVPLPGAVGASNSNFLLDHLRRRPAAGAADRARRDRRAVAEGHGEPRAASSLAVSRGTSQAAEKEPA